MPTPRRREPEPLTKVMGVLNVTPDSFSDGGAYTTAESAVQRARRMIDEGADIIDVGGESTRPGAVEVPPDEEIARIAPVVEQVAPMGVPVSIDTRKAVVAKAALDAGATFVNDVSAGTFDPAMLPLVADRRVPVVLMHMRGGPSTMDSLTDYGSDVLSGVRAELGERVRAAKHAGVEVSRILCDPGLGFAKTPEQSLEILRRIGELRTEFPLVVGPSRKRFIGHFSGLPVDDRLEGTLAACAWCAVHGVDYVRVHDVKEVRRVVDMIAAISGTGSLRQEEPDQGGGVGRGARQSLPPK